jgi:hypothetical protein
MGNFGIALKQHYGASRTLTPEEDDYMDPVEKQYENVRTTSTGF